MERHPSLPYILPFAVFILFLAIAPQLDFLGRWEFPLRVFVLAAVLAFFSRSVLDFRAPHLLGSIGLGVAVFAIWIAPDFLIPGYREHWLFQNSITGQIRSSIDGSLRSDWMVLLFRSIRAVVLVAIIEELFWRAWLMRWIINNDFRRVPLGTHTAASMWITALLFASEHGPYWDVGLIAGLLYNWWMTRTRSLGDCIVAHAVTNACLCAYVITTGRWEYWL
ncbi:MAG: CAAX prenyl protease-related protein [Bryobacteraceae bacterium]